MSKLNELHAEFRETDVQLQKNFAIRCVAEQFKFALVRKALIKFADWHYSIVKEVRFRIANDIHQEALRISEAAVVEALKSFEKKDAA